MTASQITPHQLLKHAPLNFPHVISNATTTVCKLLVIAHRPTQTPNRIPIWDSKPCIPPQYRKRMTTLLHSSLSIFNNLGRICLFTLRSSKEKEKKMTHKTTKDYTISKSIRLSNWAFSPSMASIHPSRQTPHIITTSSPIPLSLHPQTNKPSTRHHGHQTSRPPSYHFHKN